MSTSMAFHDPLSLNLTRLTTTLLSTLGPDSPYAQSMSSVTSSHALLTTLSALLSVPALTCKIAALYRPILLDLCSRWLLSDQATEAQLIALCLLAEVHEELFPVLLRLLSMPLFALGPIAFMDSESVQAMDTLRLQRLLLAYHRILQINRELPDQLGWPLSPLLKLIETPGLDDGVRLMAIRCYALQVGMPEAERDRLQKSTFMERNEVRFPYEYGQDLSGTPKEVNAWLIPVLELNRVRDARKAVVSDPIDYYSTSEGDRAFSISSADLCPLVADVHGVLLLRAGSSQPLSSTLIHTPTAQRSLQQIALNLSLRLPILLTSPPSSGKALFIQHLAEVLHSDTSNQVITIHLADTSLDPRSLLGSYASSSTKPGTFEWKDGVLVRSMREGKWVVFEDIDRGNNDVLGVIKPLVESLQLGKWIGGRAFLDIPSRGRVVAADSFRLFATRSVAVGRNGTFPSPTFFAAHKFHEITIPSPSVDELRTIIEARFPRLAGATTQGLINIWGATKAIDPAASSRDIGLRELEKFCLRVERLLPTSYASMDVDTDPESTVQLPLIFPNPTLREEIYLEARDIFFGAGTLTAASRSYSETIAALIATHLGIDDERRQWLLTARVPEYELEKDANGRTTAFRVGGVRLPAHMPKVDFDTPPLRPFAMHKPAVMLLSRIATAVSLSEPILLTGETGTGKTSVISHLATTLRRPLISLNLSHQTESSDLLGGLKPIDARVPASGLQEQFLELFWATFSRKQGEKFETEVRRAVHDGKWKRVVALWKEGARLAKVFREKLAAKQAEANANPEMNTETPRKRRKVEGSTIRATEAQWDAFLRDAEEFEVQHVHGKGKFAFGFVEGPLVKALRAGHWVLLDEINLASTETLECITGLLHGPTASITLTEQGSLEPVPRHPDFRLFACMNPATDVGKKDLPPNIRSRFTEIDVPPPDADKDTLLSIIAQYIGPHAVGDRGIIMDIAEFYTAVRKLAEARQIADGSNHRPHFSMRTLARALTFAGDIASRFSLRRAVWEGCLMGFTMVLDARSAEAVTALAHKHLLAGIRNPGSVLGKEPSLPRGRSADEFVKFGPFHLEKGPLEADMAEDYIMTPSVEQKLIDLARIILTRRFPVLIEGPTSSGKTSSIEYLARRTGHRFVRINNHEHTDIQEYIGSYVSDPATGTLVFKDGLLVRALRNGDWIVLDELNLAPTDVLEALNRLLDDNRELVIPETQEVVKPHPHFMLFATQNPPGLYGGRKVLSRAFRNRFLEVHFDDVPQHELETILCDKCRIAPSYGKKIVMVFHELQKRRQAGRVFESKQGFATLRDLFRWAGRDAVGYQELAENGYMLLAERTRREDDKTVVKEVIESVMKVQIDEKALYNLSSLPPGFLGCPTPSTEGIIWTSAMQRLFVLTARALRFNEPVLLVGETGAGKTSVCQVFADTTSQRLLGLNCHQNTETADLIGGLRPVRNRAALEAEAIQEVSKLLESVGIKPAVLSVDGLSAHIQSAIKHPDLDATHRTSLLLAHQRLQRLQAIFEWHDGPLVEAMRHGDVFLLDEISLADDSVLERLNSVLEPGRTIVLAERAGDDLEHPSIRASEDFKLVATMNPGGDYGKKELSPALRNRFTEIWVPRVDDRRDLELIVSHSWKHEALKEWTVKLLDFAEWLCQKVGDPSLAGLRDYLAWVQFSNYTYKPDLADAMTPSEIFYHAAHMTFLDGLASLPQLSSYSSDALRKLKSEATSKLHEIIPVAGSLVETVPVHDPSQTAQLGSFAIPRGPNASAPQLFNLQAPTTRDNAMRVVRAYQVPKPILLEGSPGVGKTSLITALANLAGHTLCRINLSDQTDLIDLFGADLPVEGGKPGEFAWKDAEFLTAMQEGHWVLLDEMNLAPQAVLEGLNAVLDHRGTVYIPELGRSFVKHPSFRIFAAQNPINQGGGRKGLPKSFINRFTKVYVEELSQNDLFVVCRHLFPDLDENVVRAMIAFNMALNEEVVIKHTFGREGSPWEFNLRDVLRWGLLLRSNSSFRPVDALNAIYLHRFRTAADRLQARQLFERVFTASTQELDHNPSWSITPETVEVGNFTWNRGQLAPLTKPMRILKYQLPYLESIGFCVSQSWLTILTGRHSSGKSGIIRTIANFTGNHLHEIYINHSTDTMDILGSFEQVDIRGRIMAAVGDVLQVLSVQLRSSIGFKACQDEYQKLQVAYRQHTAISNNELLAAAIESASKLACLYPDNATYKTLARKLESLAQMPDATGKFQWVDGPLVRALREGHWLLMDGANLCNPSVLDRLNSLCEADGFLVLSERGYVDGKVQVLKPHPNFKLFMTVDPHFGELSRAMRNRGIEVALLPMLMADDDEILNNHIRLPWIETSTSKKVLCVNFEASRRGIHDEPEAIRSAVVSTGRSLDQNTTLSTLVDQSAIVVISQKDVSSAHLYFLARTIGLSTLPHLQEFFQSAFEAAILHSHAASLLQNSTYFMGVIQRLLKEWSSSTSVAFDLVKAQPLDYLLNCSRSKFDPSNHSMIIRSIDLAVAMIIEDEQESPEIYQSASTNWRHEQVRRSMHSIVQGVRSVSRRIIDVLTNHDWSGFEAHLPMCLGLLQFNGRLRKVLRDDTIDYSILLAISTSLSSSLEECPDMFLPLSAHANALASAISLSSGHGLVEIWSQLFDLEKAEMLRELQNLYAILGKIKHDKLKDLHAKAFELVAMLTAPNRTSDTESVSALWQLKATIEERLRALHIADNPDNVSQYKLRLNKLILLTELYPVTSFGFGFGKGPQGQSTVMHNILNVAREALPRCLLRLTPYQHLLWLHDGGAISESDRVKLRKVITHVRSQWLEALWTPISTVDASLGPEILTQPTQLLSVTQLFAAASVTMADLTEYQTDVSRSIDLIAIGSGIEESRIQQLQNFAYQSLFLVVCCFAMHLDQRSWEQLQDLSQSFTSPTITWARRLLDFIHQSHQPLHASVEKTLMPALRRLHSAKLPSNDKTVLALVLIATGRLILDLLVPDVPLDPAVLQTGIAHHLRDRRSELEEQLQFHFSLEKILTGNSMSVLIRYLGNALNEVDQQLQQSPSPAQRKDVSRVQTFWSEIWQFHSQVISPSKLESLLHALEERVEDAPDREQVVQHSISGFCQRLETVYPDFPDILLPFKFGINHLRLGLRLLASSSTAARSTDLDGYISSLVAFPTISSITMLRATPSRDEMHGIRISEYLLLQVATFAIEASWDIPCQTSIDTLDLHYNQLMRLWLMDRAKEREVEEAAQSLYRHKETNYNPLTDSELEAMEFLELFPSFEDVLEQERQPSESKAQLTSYIHPCDIQTIASLHLSLFNAHDEGESTKFNQMRSAFTVSLLRDNIDSLSEVVDQSSLPLQFDMLSKVALRLRGSINSNSYNFYRDPNIPETKKAIAILISLRDGLENLIVEWPDQAVLQDIKGRCELILCLDIQSPIAKILTALEQLLVHTEDWETYANKENTLRHHQRLLTDLIVDWRRLELVCWKGLLDGQAKEFADQSSEWWFRLYDATIRGPLDALSQERQSGETKVDDYLTKLIPILDDYIKTSPLGQFHSRMDLLRSFGRYISTLMESKAEAERITLDRIRSVLASTTRHYEEFTSQLSSRLSKEKTELEKEIRDFIKLASWKDINVQALKQSAKRTHHQLYKIIRKFREVLRQSIVDGLEPKHAGEAESEPLQYRTPTQGGGGENNAGLGASELPVRGTKFTANHLQNIQRTYLRFQSLVGSRIQPFIHSRSASLIDDLAGQVIITTQQLASTAISEAESKERKDKLVKSLLVRKRKAWSDLLKELKRLGLSSSLKANKLSQQMDQRFMREQPMLEDPEIEGAPIVRMEKYFTRLSILMPELRSTLSSHHADIGTRELQRGIMFVESGLSFALDMRSRLSQSIRQYLALKNLSSRFRMLLDNTTAPVSGRDLLPALDALRDILSRLSFALQEVVDGVQTFQQLQQSPAAPVVVIEEVTNMRAHTERLRDQIAVIRSEINSTSTPFLVQNELSTIITAISHLKAIPEVLQVWADGAPAFKYLLQPVREWLLTQNVPELNNGVEQAGPNPIQDTLNHFLVVLQNILTLCPEKLNEEDDNDQYLLKDYHNVRTLTQRLALSETISRINSCVTWLVSTDDASQKEIATVLTFLEAYMKLAVNQLSMHIQWTTSLFKLEYVLCSIMLTLSRQGFCKPPDTDGDAEAEGTETATGVGIGSGTGNENVSKDIEDESQVEGLRGEDEDIQQTEDKRDDGDTIEMSKDVGGEMEDVPEKDENEKAESDEDSDAEPEERMGDLDASDPAAVDEKLWGDEKGPEDTQEQDDKLNEDRANEQSGESEVVAKEGQKPSKDNKEKEKEKPSKEEGVGPEEPPEAEEENLETGGEEEPDPKVSGTPMDEQVPDANTLDLPDDMNMDNNDKEGEDLGEDDELIEEIEENMDDSPDGVEEVNHPKNAEEGMEEESDQDRNNEMPSQTQDNTADQDKAPESDNEAVAKPDIGTGDGDATATDAVDSQPGRDSASGEKGSAKGAGDQGNEQEQTQTTIDEQMQQDQGPQPISNELEQESPGATNGNANHGVSQSQTTQPLSSNPLRSLGDAVKEIRQHFEEILDAHDVPQPKAGNNEAPSQLEYLHPDDEDQNMQALGPAGEEKAARLNELKMIEDDGKPPTDVPMDVDEITPPEQPPKLSRTYHTPEDAPASTTHENIEGAILNHRSSGAERNPSYADLTQKPKAETEIDDIEQHVEPELRKWREMDYPEEGAERIWRLYESLTHDLSYALCEQLRLILEPTLATRLRGDYRTGKRLNMKKIIPYIASDYTKDKIWLRRTRPSQREYQVLIALDDSRSMAESHSVHLAYQTLALVTKALNRLESGDVAIAKFGEHVDILHGFDEGNFTDQAGTKVMNAFRFNQKATNVLSLLETSLKALEAARERRAMSSSTASDLWQLEIIISDGMCQDHEKLRTLLRKAEEQRVMVVFVIIDALHSAVPGQKPGRNTQNSILSMDMAEYKMVNGRMELQLRKYLDSFPFEYFVVLRSVEALPDILSATLKQFFERVSEE